MKAEIIRRARHPETGVVLEGGEVLELKDDDFATLQKRGQAVVYEPPPPAAAAPPPPAQLGGPSRVDEQATHKVLRRTRLQRAGRAGVLEPGDHVALTDAEAKTLGDDAENPRAVLERLPTPPSPAAVPASAAEPEAAAEAEAEPATPSGDDTAEAGGRRRKR